MRAQPDSYGLSSLRGRSQHALSYLTAIFGEAGAFLSRSRQRHARSVASVCLIIWLTRNRWLQRLAPVADEAWRGRCRGQRASMPSSV